MTYPLAAVAVGRSMVGAILMASQLKDGQMVGLFSVATALCKVFTPRLLLKAKCVVAPYPQYQPESYDKGLSLKEALGTGTMSVARHQPFQKQPFHGTVELVSGEIGEDIAHYLPQSHQIRSLVSLGVYLDKYGKVQAAGGC